MDVATSGRLHRWRMTIVIGRWACRFHLGWHLSGTAWHKTIPKFTIINAARFDKLLRYFILCMGSAAADDDISKDCRGMKAVTSVTQYRRACSRAGASPGWASLDQGTDRRDRSSNADRQRATITTVAVDTAADLGLKSEPTLLRIILKTANGSVTAQPAKAEQLRSGNMIRAISSWRSHPLLALRT